MKKIDWSYHRQNCETCKKSRSYFETHGMEIKTEVDARKTRFSPAEVLDRLSKMDRLYVTKGKNYLELDLKKSRPQDEDLLKLVIGPSGNLRAPTIQIGKTMLVGFNSEMYSRVS